MAAMRTERLLTRHSRKRAGFSAVTCLFTGAMVLVSALAAAQERPQAPGAKAADEPALFESIGHWLDEQAAKFKSTFSDAGKGVENFGHEAGVAAKTTVNSAKDAADAVARIPAARVVSGHEKCKNAANGAPDCVSAANAICKTKGFESGKSLDMTTAVVCPPKVLLSGQSSGPECRDETFVSRALCQ
jgi:hypothetical protein